MEKGIIIVDMPKSCVDWDFCRKIDDGVEACCEITIDPDDYDCYRIIEDYYHKKPDWCPIRLMPKHEYSTDRTYKNIEWLDGYDCEWNVCLDSIEGRKDN